MGGRSGSFHLPLAGGSQKYANRPSFSGKRNAIPMKLLARAHPAGFCCTHHPLSHRCEGRSQDPRHSCAFFPNILAGPDNRLSIKNGVTHGNKAQ